MKITISFKNLEHTDSLDERIKKKSQKLGKYFGGNTEIHWTCHVEEDLHCADIKLIGPSFQYNASSKADNMYKTLDQAINKIEKQLSKKKSKWKSQIHRGEGTSIKDLNEILTDDDNNTTSDDQ